MILVMPDVNYILFMVVAIVCTIILGLFFLWRIKVNSKKMREESETILDETLSKNAIRTAIEKYIDKVGAYGACGVIYVDIDGFGDLNDALGYATCDDLLREIALRILKVIPFKASLSRYQNDEFMIFIRDENSRDILEDVAEKVTQIINAPFRVTMGDDINISASVGVVSYPSCGISFQELYNNLELSTYVSKRDGGNRFTYFYTELGQEEVGNMEYYKEVKSAIKNKEFCLYYQPIIDIEKNLMYGAEALMRWNHPKQGVLAPQKFLSILEQSGDIKWVGQWGLESMIKMYLEMKEKHPELTLKFSLNLSTKQLLDPLLSIEFIDLVKKYGVEPNNFMLEIAEFTMYEKIGQVKTTLMKLKDSGFLIAVDGFDLDQTTMAGIERAPIDVIKLDRGFLKELDNNFMKEKFVAMLVEFAKNNDHTVICEGVENDEMVKYVRKNNVKIAQGYYFSKPISEADFEAYAAERKWRKTAAVKDQLEGLEGMDFNAGVAQAATENNEEDKAPKLTDSQSTYVDFESTAVSADFANSTPGEAEDETKSDDSDVNFDEDSSNSAKF